jgi:poly-gamma-glutamate capsule biosynthesis protein CapA/YwtB (metallophosphatase superfamily)
VRSRLSVAGWLGLSLAIILIAACKGGGASQPTTVRLAADSPLADRALAAAQESLALKHLGVEQAVDAASADIVVSATPAQAKDALAFATGYWVAALQLSSPLREITMAQLGDAVAGRSANWRRVLVPVGAPPFDQWWPDLTPAVETLPLDQIPPALAADPGALALLPLDTVDARVRSLTVDGVNIVFGIGDTGAYALTQRAWITTRKADNKTFGETLSALAIDLAKTMVNPPPDPIVLRSTGDVIPSRCAYAKQRDYGDFRHAFLELGPWLAQADITTGSLDATISDESPPFGCIDTFNLAAPAASVEGLAYAGYDVITNATNHAMDCGQVGACGPDALFATNDNLRSHGIQPVGSGADLADARKPVILTVKGVRFAFLGYDDIAEYYHATLGVAGTAPLDEAYVREDVAAAATQADVVIVMPHWGVEYTSDPTERQRAIAAAAFESGATMVIGNHPHWVQAVQATHSTFVTYALGNFVFDQDWSLETQQGAVLEAAFHGAQLKGVEIYPVHIFDQNQPAFAGPDEARQVLDRIWEASARLP